MLFNSLNFAVFFPVVFLLYWLATKGRLRQQNILLLVASYFFYASWDYRFLFLLMFSTLLDYFSGIRIAAVNSRFRQRCWLWVSIIINLGFLAVFKYFDFFAASFAAALSMLGLKANFFLLNVILPVGISFYTFHGLSYVFDTYNRRVKPERNIIDYALFVSFFPLLVAGPIERATHLLPQLKKKRVFDHAKAIDGCRQILWGLFKKVVIADNCSVYVDTVFNDPASFSGSTLLLAAIFFAIQIYCDFSGYSDIALGTARLLGIELLRNFAFPYFSRSIAEFWRRWHISLSSWFRDYLYIPLGGSKGTIIRTARNVLIVFLLSGLWHGANWTFVAWGLLHALYILPSFIFNTNRKDLQIVAAGRLFPTLKEFLLMGGTFALTVFAWIFFRANNLHQAFSYIAGIFSLSLFETPDTASLAGSIKWFYMCFLVMFIITEWIGRKGQHALEHLLAGRPRLVRWAFYYFISMIIFLFAAKEQQFIYFQF